jgi:hypothetical protein
MHMESAQSRLLRDQCTRSMRFRSLAMLLHMCGTVHAIVGTATATPPSAKRPHGTASATTTPPLPHLHIVQQSRDVDARFPEPLTLGGSSALLGCGWTGLWQAASQVGTCSWVPAMSTSSCCTSSCCACASQPDCG